MDEGMIIDLGQQVLQLVAMLLAPIMGTSMIVGLLISMFQAATQIQEMTLTFVPKKTKFKQFLRNHFFLALTFEN